MVRYYALQAAEYNQNYAPPKTQKDLRTIASLLAQLFANRWVYEVACGTGRWTQKLAQVAVAVYAIDINESMLAIAREQAYPPNIVTLARGDAYAINVSGEKFTGGLVGFWLSHVDLRRMEEFLIFHLETKWVLAYQVRKR
jgi:ubiquinone/menaquinone biosynthesis C-methylase UbiE